MTELTPEQIRKAAKETIQDAQEDYLEKVELQRRKIKASTPKSTVPDEITDMLAPLVAARRLEIEQKAFREEQSASVAKLTLEISDLRADLSSIAHGINLLATKMVEISELKTQNMKLEREVLTQIKAELKQ